MRRLLAAFLLASLASGIAATAYWLSRAGGTGFSTHGRMGDLAILLAIAALSSVNFTIRWFRWHFLVRRFVRTLPTRASLKLYFGTLAAFATPLYLGEMIRTALAGRRRAHPRGMVLGVWASERLADAVALAGFLVLAQGRWRAGALGLAALAGVTWGARRRARGSVLRELAGGRALAVLGASSLLAWGMPIAALWISLRQLGDPVAMARAAEVFSVGSFLGGLSLLPLGSGVAGSSMIVQLAGAGVDREHSIAAVALFRAGTSWYALGLGLLALVYWRRELAGFVRARPDPDHFDALAPEYDEQIPAHVRDRVVGRKVDAMAGWLDRTARPPAARGLELGCGHAWYAAEMARRGYAVMAGDRSRGQTGAARRFLAGRGGVALAAFDARALPFPDECFDFAYAVNVLHHVPGPAGAARALREVTRVLRPGGSFFLHEINTENPLFAFYMGYVFPLLRDIDDGTEIWIRPSALPRVEGARWDDERAYLTFLPDFVPPSWLERLGGVERALERSRFRSWSAHYVARLVKAGDSGRDQR